MQSIVDAHFAGFAWSLSSTAVQHSAAKKRQLLSLPYIADAGVIYAPQRFRGRLKA